MSERSVEYGRLARRIWQGGLAAVVLAAVVYAVALWLFDGQRLSRLSGDWGTFGDFVGGVAGTIVSVLTLWAIARTLKLQADELEATTIELKKQTAAAQASLALTRRYEALKYRPFLKTEWFVVESSAGLMWRITNVGLGPAIMERVEVFHGDELVGKYPAFHDAAALEIWRRAFRQILRDSYPGDASVSLYALTEFKSVLGVNEFQATARIDFTGNTERGHAKILIEASLRPIVHFRSLDNHEWATHTQAIVDVVADAAEEEGTALG